MEKISETWNWLLDKTTLNKPNTRQMVVNSILFVTSAVLMGVYGRGIVVKEEEKNELVPFDEEEFFRAAYTQTRKMMDQ